MAGACHKRWRCVLIDGHITLKLGRCFKCQRATSNSLSGEAGGVGESDDTIVYFLEIYCAKTVGYHVVSGLCDSRLTQLRRQLSSNLG